MKRIISVFVLLILTLCLLTSCGIRGEDGRDGINGQNGADGKDGVDGSTIHRGSGAPEATAGRTGDYYLDTDSFTLYARGAEGWILLGTLKGEDGKDGDDGENGTDGKDVERVSNGSYIHLSLDDVSTCFYNLSSNSYSSLYDEPLFSALLDWHNEYGAVFSLYTYNSVLDTVPDRYGDDFFAAREWLKIGLHAKDPSSSFNLANYSEGLSEWNEFVGHVVRITGSYHSVDRMPRLHTFGGSLEALRGMRDAKCGAIGFISADDSRNSYYFGDSEKEYLYTHDYITDTVEGLMFVATDLRFDWFSTSFTSANSYRAPTKKSVYDELCYRYASAEFANSGEVIIAFGHEWAIYNGSALSADGAAHFEGVMQFAKEMDIGFAFPESGNYRPTQGDIK